MRVRICDGCEKTIDETKRNVVVEVGQKRLDLCQDCIPHFDDYRHEMDGVVARTSEYLAAQEAEAEAAFWKKVRSLAKEEARTGETTQG